MNVREFLIMAYEKCCFSVIFVTFVNVNEFS